jgi:hypothetical protein
VVRNKLERHRQRDGAHAAEELVLADREGRAGCVGEPVHAAGETLAQAIAIPIHLATLIPCVARFLIEFPIEEMRDGDIYCMNDPYLGGTHLPDIAVVMPVFARGRPIASPPP